MSEKTGIAWTDHTFNPWWGCAKVSPGCDHCYAERDAGRFNPSVALWGVDAARREFGDKHWNEPRKWNAKGRSRVFCASMADVFDNHETAERLRPRLWQLIRDTPRLNWQILTKRIGNAKRMLPPDWGNGYPNVWLGSSVVNQEEADRDIDRLLRVPAAIRFLSCEPLLDEITIFSLDGPVDVVGRTKSPLDWVIVGGESGSKARQFDVAWARDIRDQCRSAGVAVFIKQLGANVAPLRIVDSSVRDRLWLKDRAGADPSEWPPDLRVQEFPA